jgi:hypothetical protein
MTRASDRFVELYCDVDIRYGGLWIKDCGDYAEWVEVTDLDSATGTSGLILVASGSVGFYARDLADMRSVLDGALNCCGYRRNLLAAETREWRRLMAWEALYGYKRGDLERWEVIRTDGQAPCDQEDHGFTATSTIESERELRDYLSRAYDIPCDWPADETGTVRVGEALVA